MYLCAIIIPYKINCATRPYLLDHQHVQLHFHHTTIFMSFCIVDISFNVSGNIKYAPRPVAPPVLQFGQTTSKMPSMPVTHPPKPYPSVPGLAHCQLFWCTVRISQISQAMQRHIEYSVRITMKTFKNKAKAVMQTIAADANAWNKHGQ